MILEGRGGGGSKKGADANANNTLRSKARAHLIQVLSEGPIEGIVGGTKGVMFAQTPVQNEDGSFNFQNVDIQERRGYPDDAHTSGFSNVQTTISVETEVKNANGPVVRTITEVDADAVRVIIRINSLFKIDSDDGSTKTNRIDYSIDLRTSGGGWTEVVRNNLANQKCTSPAQIAHRIDLPSAGHPWDIRVRSNIADPGFNDDKDVRSFTFEGMVILVEGRFTYPHTAMASLSVNAEDMGQQIPDITYRVRGRIVSVPSNYDPIARTYAGVWDGTFKQAWTRCPPWIYYDMVINDRYGLGEFVDPVYVDKWTLYAIGQHCDQMIPSGFKDINGNDIYEPRFTFDGVINTREDAIDLLHSMTAVWRGMGYWSMNQIFVTADMPADPVQLVTPANVVNGELKYASTSMRARHSVALVKWNNPDDHFAPDTEVVINHEMLAKFGWREKQVQVNGIATRGLAHRHGKWILDTEQSETETLEYVAGLDHMRCKPGDIIAVSDPRKANVRAAGRIKSHNLATNILIIDAPFLAAPGVAYRIMLKMQDGNVVISDIANFNSSTELLVSGLGVQIMEGAAFVIAGADVNPRLFRVLTVEEDSLNLFKVTALFHDPTKYARVEQGLFFEQPPYRRPVQIIEPVSNLQVSFTTVVRGGGVVSIATLSWTPPVTTLYRGFSIEMESASGGRRSVGGTDTPSIDIENIDAGEITFFVKTVGTNGQVSRPVTITAMYMGELETPPPYVEELWLEEDRNGTVFSGSEVAVRWRNRFFETSNTEAVPDPSENEISPLYRHNTLRVYDVATNSLLREKVVTGQSFTYGLAANRNDNAALGRSVPSRALRFEVSVTDIAGRQSDFVSLGVSNPVPAMIAPYVSTTLDTIRVNWELPDDADIAGTLVWISNTSGFNPLTTTPIFDGAGSEVTWNGIPGDTYYVRAAAYDRFGKTGLNISPEQLVEANDMLNQLQSLFDAAGLTTPQIVDVLPELPSPFKLVFLRTNSKLYRNTGTDWTAVVEGTDIDGRGLDILDLLGNKLFGSDGSISPAVHVSTNGNVISLGEIAAIALIPSLNFVGEFATAPTAVDLGDDWRQNAIYKNTTNGKSYVLTGDPLAWLEYISDGYSFSLVIESTNGTVFRVGLGQSTLLKARLFRNGAEVTDVTPASWFRWRRASIIPQSPPNDDASWDALYQTGYKQISIDVDQVLGRATFFCDIISQ